MPSFRSFIAFACLAFFFEQSTLASPAKPFRLKLGFGYETISQEYFQDSIIAGDSLGLVGKFRTTYLDEFRGIASLQYTPREDQRVDLEASAERSKSVSRFRFRTELSPTLGSVRIQFGAELDRRSKRTSGSDSLDDSYLLGSFAARGEVKLSESKSLIFRGTSDFIQFDSISSGLYNYARFGGKVWIDFRLGEFSNLTFTGFGQARRVADSVYLDYSSFGLETFFFGLFENSDLDITGRWEHRSYNRPDKGGDFNQFELEAEHSWSIGSMLLREHGLNELLLFGSEDSLSPSRYRGKLVAQAGREFGAWKLLAGPAVEYLDERGGGIIEAEDYHELGGEIELELLTQSGLLATLNSSVGERNVRNEGKDRSDFWFGRFNLIIDGKVLGELRLSALVSADREWHERADHDNTIYLVSAGLSYTL